MAVPCSPQPKAVIELLAGADCEGWGLFVVKGTAGDKLVASFAQRDITVDQIDDIGAINERVDKLLRDPAAQGLSTKNR